MAKPGIGKKAIGIANAPDDLVELIDKRRDALSWSRSEYALKVLQWWQAQGAPGVTPADNLVLLSQMGMVAEDPAPYRKKK